MNDRIDRWVTGPVHWVGRLSTGAAGGGPCAGLAGGGDVNSWTGDDENAKTGDGQALCEGARSRSPQVITSTQPSYLCTLLTCTRIHTIACSKRTG